MINEPEVDELPRLFRLVIVFRLGQPKNMLVQVEAAVLAAVPKVTLCKEVQPLNIEVYMLATEEVGKVIEVRAVQLANALV